MRANVSAGKGADKHACGEVLIYTSAQIVKHSFIITLSVSRRRIALSSSSLA